MNVSQGNGAAGDSSADQQTAIAAATPVIVESPVSAAEGRAPATVRAGSTTVPLTTEGAWLWLRRGDQVIVGLMVTLFLILLGMHWLRLSHWGRSPIELSSQLPREYFYSLDINAASWVEWAQLDGIGETLARRIVADRERHGPFRNPGDVGRVRGIGPKIMERIAPFLRGGTDPVEKDSESSRGMSATP